MSNDESARILCVEDDEDTCHLFAFVLESEGYSVVHAATFEEAVAKTEGDEFALLILDNHLPDGNGLELCRRIRADGNQTPILFDTG